MTYRDRSVPIPLCGECGKLITMILVCETCRARYEQRIDELHRHAAYLRRLANLLPADLTVKAVREYADVMDGTWKPKPLGPRP